MMEGLYIKNPQPAFQGRLGDFVFIYLKIPFPYFFIISSTALMSWVS